MIGRTNVSVVTIGYNHLNLPNYFTNSGGAEINITYDASGQKWYSNAGGTVATHYFGEIEYNNNNLEAIYHEDGRIVPLSGTTYEYHFYLKDHLGNIRTVVKGTQAAPVLMQEYHYYPFGMAMDGSWVTQTGLGQKYLYNGKELVDDLGLNWYDYGARWYDASVGRWMQVDPLAYKFPQWSPCSAFGDNPINNIDLDGRYFIGVNGKAVKFKQRKNGTLKISRNASADLKYLVKAVNKSGSRTAMNQIFEASQNKTKISVKIETEVHDKVGQLGYGLLGLHQAHDAGGNALNWNSEKGDFDGVPAYVEGEEGVYREATIIIFKGNIEESGGNGWFYGVDVTVEQEVANTFQHEAHHDTDREFIQDLKNKREGKPNKGIDDHQNISPQEKKVYDEMDNNRIDIKYFPLIPKFLRRHESRF